jgi:AcrR family transcriptional regulator
MRRETMGRQAATKVQAGAEGTGRIEEVGALAHAPKLELVNSSKREKILEGMLEAVGAEGYDGTSVRTVLDRTGLYRQAFYDHFADKDACYLARSRWESAGSKRWFRERQRAKRPGEGSCGPVWAPCSDYLDEEPDFGRGVIVEVHARAPRRWQDVPKR